MFDNLSGRLSDAARQLSGKGRLTETNIKDTLASGPPGASGSGRRACPSSRPFDRIRERALGEEVGKSLTPGQALVKIIHAELVRILGSESAPLDLRAQPPVVILLAGLQGAGKTTTAAKLAKRLIDAEKKKVMLVSVDVHRPAAILQLQTLAGEVALHCTVRPPSDRPLSFVAHLMRLVVHFADVLIVDTAGRLHIDGEMMQEVIEVHEGGATSRDPVRRR